MNERRQVFDSQNMRRDSHMAAGAGTAGLHVCPSCGSQLVQPTCWEQTGRRGNWRVWRRCPECQWHCSGVHGEREIDAYDVELDHGTAKLAGKLEDLQRESMEQLADTFATALASDLIGADDFR